MAELANGNGDFQFSIEEDARALSACAAVPTRDVAGRITSDLTYILEKYAGASAYMRVNQRPVIFFYGMEGYKLDWDRIQSSVSANPVFIFRSSDGTEK